MRTPPVSRVRRLGVTVALVLALPAAGHAYTCTAIDGGGCPLTGATCYAACDETDVRALLATVNGCPPVGVTIAMGPDAGTTCGTTPIPMAMAATAPGVATGACGDDDPNRYNALCLATSDVVFDGRGAIFTYAGDHVCASCSGNCEGRQPALVVLEGNRNTVQNLELRFFPEGVHLHSGSNHTIRNVTNRYICEDALSLDDNVGAGHRIVGTTLVGNTTAATGGGACWVRNEGIPTCTDDAGCAAAGAGARCYCGRLSTLGDCLATPGRCYVPSLCGHDKAIQVNGGGSTIGGDAPGDANRLLTIGQPVRVLAGTHNVIGNVTCGDPTDKNVCQAYAAAGGAVTFRGNRIDHCKFGIRVEGNAQVDAVGNVVTNGYVSAFQLRGTSGGRLRGSANRMRRNGYATTTDCQRGAIVVRDGTTAQLDFGGGNFAGAPVIGGVVSAGGNLFCQNSPADGPLAHVWNMPLDATCACVADPTGAACGAGASIGLGAVGTGNSFDPLPVLVPQAIPNVLDALPVDTRADGAATAATCDQVIVSECDGACRDAPDGTPCRPAGVTGCFTCQQGICADTVAPDGDGDGVCDPDDDCPADADPTQHDADGDGIGDACDPFDGPLVVQTARLKPTRAPGLTTGSIVVSGSYPTTAAWDAPDPASGAQARVTDGAALDLTVAWTPDRCVRSGAGAFACRSIDGRARLKLRPQRRPPRSWTLGLQLRSLDLSGPLQGPVTLRLRYGAALDRSGAAASCLLRPNGLSCKWPALGRRPLTPTRWWRAASRRCRTRRGSRRAPR